MASKPRISAPDVFYHITARGIPERDIFPTLDLKRFFLQQLAISLKRFVGISGSAISKMISKFLNDQVGFSFLKKIKAEIR